MATGQAGAILQHIQRLAETHIGPGVTDGQLLQRFTVHRDDRAFAALVRRHGRLVWGVCRHILHREHDAEDAFQATFLVLARRAASIRQGESVGSWLYGVAYRIALRAKKMAVKRQERERLAAAPEAGPAAPDPAWRELQTLLAEEVQRLPKKYRAPFVSCCLEGRSRKEAAADLGWKVGTVSSRIAQARRLLQERLARRGVLLPAALTAGVLWGQTAAAAVPAALVCATVKAAAGPAGAALISANVAGLMHEGMKAMLGAKLKLATALLLVAGLVAGGAGLAARQAPASPTADEKEETPKSAAKAARPSPNADKPAHTDRYGDPLPEGAAARLGTMRLRTADARLLAFLPDRKSLLSVASQEHGAVVSVWEVNTGKLHRRFGTTHFTNSYALSPDGKTLAAIAYDYRTGHRRLILLDVATGQELLRLGGFGAGAV